ncbi:formate/nitrite transporter family protein [Streptococcus himalayensis]|uniref:Formate transporter n=1 Tax=Streptococcus himalayensis TaxID=1888195 RepID=A0A917EE00_9STRE|nr:formate/nitrite transporter family protein [Streptococcus himalayensis]GGE29697.1 formate transporter [Streptococcus himalayensis]
MPLSHTLIEKLAYSIEKKEDLSRKSIARYAVRAILATMYITLGTAIGVYISHYANVMLPGSGKFFYAFMFSGCLLMIFYMNAELGTSNMMYMTSAVYNQQLKWQTALKILSICLFFNFVGAVLFSYLISLTNAFNHLETGHYLFDSVAAKLDKSSLSQFVEGILANIVVNTAVIVYLQMKDDGGRVPVTIFIIYIFAFLGFEHLIANFASFSLAFFINGGAIDGMTAIKVVSNFFFAFLGNYVGGGLLIGLVYSWLNKGNSIYRD